MYNNNNGNTIIQEKNKDNNYIFYNETKNALLSFNKWKMQKNNEYKNNGKENKFLNNKVI